MGDEEKGISINYILKTISFFVSFLENCFCEMGSYLDRNPIIGFLGNNGIILMKAQIVKTK